MTVHTESDACVDAYTVLNESSATMSAAATAVRLPSSWRTSR